MKKIKENIIFDFTFALNEPLNADAQFKQGISYLEVVDVDGVPHDGDGVVDASPLVEHGREVD